MKRGAQYSAAYCEYAYVPAKNILHSMNWWLIIVFLILMHTILQRLLLAFRFLLCFLPPSSVGSFFSSWPFQSKHSFLSLAPSSFSIFSLPLLDRLLLLAHQLTRNQYRESSQPAEVLKNDRFTVRWKMERSCVALIFEMKGKVTLHLLKKINFVFMWCMIFCDYSYEKRIFTIYCRPVWLLQNFITVQFPQKYQRKVLTH